MYVEERSYPPENPSTDDFSLSIADSINAPVWVAIALDCVREIEVTDDVHECCPLDHIQAASCS